MRKKKIVAAHKGILVARKTSLSQFFFLFQMDYFYVETCFNLNSKAVEGYNMFLHTAPLERESIAIDDLLN